MEALTIFSVFVLICLVLLALIWFSDCDLLLLWKSHYGAKNESLAGKVVWITGASSGIGEFLAYELAKNKCHLVLSARRTDELERVKNNCLAKGGLKRENVVVLRLDVLDFNSYFDAVRKVQDRFGKIDILVNNAGRSQRAMAMDTSNEVEKHLIEINVLSVTSLTKTVLPFMIRNGGGHIVVNSSLAGKTGSPFSAAYSATKFALQGWFDALRTEQTENNIRVTMICPGPVFSNLRKSSYTEVLESSNEEMHPSEKRMSTERCAQLMTSAIVNEVYEAWISQNPHLMFAYCAQYIPTTFKWVAGIIGLQFIKKVRFWKT